MPKLIRPERLSLYERGNIVQFCRLVAHTVGLDRPMQCADFLNLLNERKEDKNRQWYALYRLVYDMPVRIKGLHVGSLRAWAAKYHSLFWVDGEMMLRFECRTVGTYLWVASKAAEQSADQMEAGNV
jgi:hypothetical protein